MKKGKWSKEEDNLIKNHIEKYGIGRSWQELSNALGLQRCGRSCRSRWLNYLRPGLKHGNFTPAEDRIICEMYKKRGSCWSVIAAELPGRTDLAVKNYWNCTLKKRLFLPLAARGAAARRRVHRRSGSTSSDAASPDLALVVYDEERIGTAAAPDLALVVYSEERTSTATAPDPAVVVYNEEESATAGSSSSNAGGVSVDMPVLAVSPSPSPSLDAAVNAANEEPIAAVPVSGPRIEPPSPPPPPVDQTGEMDVGCAPMSPLPLGLMDPDLPCMAMAMDLMDLPPIAGFDDIDSFLSFFHG